jgi:hypothetical protein
MFITIVKNYRVKLLKKPDVTDLAGEKVMIDFESGKYFMLTGAANEIWDMLADGAESEGIVGELTGIYDVEPDVCRNGVLSFLNEIAGIGFISLEECTTSAIYPPPPLIPMERIR